MANPILREDEKQAKIDELHRILDAVAKQMNIWADQSIKGGWSTHQVEPMRKLAGEIRRKLDIL
jgi:hypothetical protein